MINAIENVNCNTTKTLRGRGSGIPDPKSTVQYFYGFKSGINTMPGSCWQSGRRSPVKARAKIQNAGLGHGVGYF